MPLMKYFGNSRWRSRATRNSPSVRMIEAVVTSKCKPRRSWTASEAQPLKTVPARTSFFLSTASNYFLDLIFAAKLSIETMSVPSRLTKWASKQRCARVANSSRLVPFTQPPKKQSSLMLTEHSSRSGHEIRAPTL